MKHKKSATTKKSKSKKINKITKSSVFYNIFSTNNYFLFYISNIGVEVSFYTAPEELLLNNKTTIHNIFFY